MNWLTSESGNMPEWAEDDPQKYWAAADAHERANGSLFKEVEFALPVELDDGQQRELASSFAADLTGGERLPYTMAIHRGGQDGENPHVHLMISERGLDGHDRDAATWFKRAHKAEPEKGGALKTRSMMGKEWLENTRAAWARGGKHGVGTRGIGGADRPPQPCGAAAGSHRARADGSSGGTEPDPRRPPGSGAAPGAARRAVAGCGTGEAHQAEQPPRRRDRRHGSAA